jgi:hypothetical protein
MRVRKNACLWSAPPAYSGRGRPRKHGQKMKLNDPDTWMEADFILESDHHPGLGLVRVLDDGQTCTFTVQWGI